jgi:hypothetical protein
MLTTPIRFGAWEGAAYYFDGHWWVPARPIAQFLGLAWQRQAAKIRGSDVVTCVTIKVTQVGDQARDFLALRTDDIGLWLMTIAATKVAETAKPALIEMQRNLRAAIEAQINEAFGIPSSADLQQLLEAPVPTDSPHVAIAVAQARVELLAEPGVARAALMFKLGLPGTKTGALLGRSAYWANKRRRRLEALFVLEPRRPVLPAPANDPQADLFQEASDA